MNCCPCNCDEGLLACNHCLDGNRYPPSSEAVLPCRSCQGRGAIDCPECRPATDESERDREEALARA